MKNIEIIKQLKDLSNLELNAENVLMSDVNDNFTSINVEGALNELHDEQESLKLSVSNGKKLIATAITDKGIETSSDATFQVMADNISNIETMTGTFEPDDTANNSPGPGYEMELDLTGLDIVYCGKVNGLITGVELSNLTGVTNGVLAHSEDITWLKFKVNGKTLFVADRNIRTGISWDQINSANCIRGDKVIDVKGNYYICRLLTGGNQTISTVAGGEWNNTIVKYTPNNSDSNWSDVYTWCQEVNSSHTSNRVMRGGETASNFTYGNSGYAFSHYGWRPTLEVL